MNNLINTWHLNQTRTEKNTFKPKWDKETVLWIIEEVNKMTNFIDIQYQLVKKYGISLASAALWIEMSRRITVHVAAGLSIDEALEHDKKVRNQIRRWKNKKSPDKSV